jgi:hypothetical protein
MAFFYAKITRATCFILFKGGFITFRNHLLADSVEKIDLCILHTKIKTI